MTIKRIETGKRMSQAVVHNGTDLEKADAKTSPVHCPSPTSAPHGAPSPRETK